MSDESTDDWYAREDTEKTVSAFGFGRGKSDDDIYVALDYLYHDENIKEKHGTTFEIKAEDIGLYTSEGQCLWTTRFWKGHAECSIKIDNSYYRVKLTKSYFGKWEVKECYLEEEVTEF